MSEWPGHPYRRVSIWVLPKHSGGQTGACLLGNSKFIDKNVRGKEQKVYGIFDVFFPDPSFLCPAPWPLRLIPSPMAIIVYSLTLLSKWSAPFHSARAHTPPSSSIFSTSLSLSPFTSPSLSSAPAPSPPIELCPTRIPIYQYKYTSALYLDRGSVQASSSRQIVLAFTRQPTTIPPPIATGTHSTTPRRPLWQSVWVLKNGPSPNPL